MKRLFVRRFNVMMMRWTPETVGTIMSAIDIVTNERYGKATCREFNSAYPEQMVIEFNTTRKVFNKIRQMIENAYPGTCVFNAQW